MPLSVWILEPCRIALRVPGREHQGAAPLQDCLQRVSNADRKH